MSTRRLYNTTVNNFNYDETEKLSDQLDRLEYQQNGCELLLKQPKLLDRFFEDSQMNDISLLTQFFQFLIKSMKKSRENAVKLILRLPNSDLLKFTYAYLRPLSSTNEKEKNLLEKFVPIVSEILQRLLEIHPFCWEQLNSLGIFDRLELYTQKTSDENIHLQVTELISCVDNLREEYKRKNKKIKSKVQNDLEPDEPPPNDFHELSIYPTLDEIFQQQIPYLRKNITSGQYQNGTHYLDIHFRLLREDFLHPLREAICQYMGDDNRNVSFQNANVRLYRNTILKSTICSHIGILFSMQIDMRTLPKSISWRNSRRLIYGNLLAATFDDFATSCFLLTVEDRSNIDQDGTISVRCQKELCGYQLMKTPPGTSFTLLETTSYFEAYRPILQALQNIKEDRLPLEKYLLHCDTDVSLPDYFEEKSKIDFQPLLIKNAKDYGELHDQLSDVKDLTTWPNAQQLGLDDSQYKALQLALTKAVALIQGPPGCGKTFLGVRLAELFYHNRERITGCNRPILMICYTNHALDQFLSTIIQKLHPKSGEIVRVGGRSTNPEIEPFLIQKLRQQRRNVRVENKELSDKYEIIKIIKKQLDNCEEKYYNCSQEILDITQLLRVMNRNQFLSIIEPILSKLDIFNNHWKSSKCGIDCKSDDSDESDSDSEKNDESLSWEEKMEADKNRTNCHKLNKLSKNDQNKMNQLFIQWLTSKQSHSIINQIEEHNEDDDVDDDDDGGGEFQKPRKRGRKKNEAKATVLKDTLNDLFLQTTTTTTNSTNMNEENQINIEDDEEETKRLDNVDHVAIPFKFPSQTNEKEKKQINTEQLEFMQRLLYNRTALLSDDAVNNITDLWSRSIGKEQRQALYRYWLCKYVQLLTEEWYNLNEQYDENYQLMQNLWLTNDRLYMNDAFIIAMTTHCASRYQKVLKEIAPRICIVEEAAEVFESHIITAIGERIEHLILIGDHVQLRPSPNVYTLAKQFNLDVSLFERLIKNQMPSVQLCVQHRSIPMISSLTHHFYDISILNHESVLNRPSIKGVNHPLYFIDHQNFEENVADGSSKRNIHESDYVIQLANYLIQQGYDKKDITILTTYMGQRQRIQKTISQQFKHLQGIHITVVDNFQGEENRIILLSLVRSNADQRLGYIAVDNRICVALSRAQNGLYVIGNFHLLVEHNETWKIIINKIKQLKLIGTGLPIHCINHRDNQIICQHPNDFLKRPLGGCGLQCETRLSCGHQCPLKCHSTSHDTVVCHKTCQKKYNDCDHQCGQKCHPTAECLPCSEMIKLKMPNCEHISDIPCFMTKTNQLECAVQVSYTCSIGHKVQVRCCDLRNEMLKDRLCIHPCDATLECGHICKGTCSTCHQKRFHYPCDQQELIVYMCGHSRQQRCHELGPRCTQPYIKICDHKDIPDIPFRSPKCAIYQCNRYCLNNCKHNRCSERCKNECDRLPCSSKCTRRLHDGHYCFGVCGEPCIACLNCRETELPDEIRAAINGRNKRNISFVELECGHLITTDKLDEHAQKFEQENFLPNEFMHVEYPRCPKCQYPLVKCKRYSTLIKKIHGRLDKFYSGTETLLVDTLRQRRDSDNNRQKKLCDLFIHVVGLFQNLKKQVSTERDKILEAVYEHVKKNDSLFLTRQQWLDLEHEYNRLVFIDRFKTLKEALTNGFNQSEIQTLNDNLFGPNQFTQSICQKCKTLLYYADDDNDIWQTILPDQLKWDEYEKDQHICDRKWMMCSKGHLMWVKDITEQLTCLQCQSNDNGNARIGMPHRIATPPLRRGGYRRSYRR
ncbi:unnamed protein product [Adineta steineri]|uniref:NF-X1-type domain-containing protein n=1 Tax=Adineta steineri TaxID=433720 RepID=A0A818GEG2_9BILA|nr:unnamed protein product [Adineta steineri]